MQESVMGSTRSIRRRNNRRRSKCTKRDNGKDKRVLGLVYIIQNKTKER
jgi:hypothetical protein